MRDLLVWNILLLSN